MLETNDEHKNFPFSSARRHFATTSGPQIIGVLCDGGGARLMRRLARARAL